MCGSNNIEVTSIDLNNKARAHVFRPAVFNPDYTRFEGIKILGDRASVKRRQTKNENQ